MNQFQEFDPRTRARITEHFSNFDDQITDEDIRNVRTNFDGQPVVERPAPLVVNNQPDVATGQEDPGTDPAVETSWNILQ